MTRAVAEGKAMNEQSSDGIDHCGNAGVRELYLVQGGTKEGWDRMLFEYLQDHSHVLSAGKERDPDE